MDSIQLAIKLEELSKIMLSTLKPNWMENMDGNLDSKHITPKETLIG